MDAWGLATYFNGTLKAACTAISTSPIPTQPQGSWDLEATGDRQGIGFSMQNGTVATFTCSLSPGTYRVSYAGNFASFQVAGTERETGYDGVVELASASTVKAQTSRAASWTTGGLDYPTCSVGDVETAAVTIIKLA